MLRSITPSASHHTTATTATEEESPDHLQEEADENIPEASTNDTTAEATATDTATDNATAETHENTTEVSTKTSDLNYKVPKEHLFNITTDETSQMKALIDNLHKSTTRRYSLQNNTSLKWNPKMNEGPAVVSAEQQGPAE